MNAKTRLSALLLAPLLAAAALFLLCYQYDNKYTAKGPQPVAGVLLLNKDALERFPVVWLVRDWEIYRGRLLSPEDFEKNRPYPDELVFIGQYGGFEGRVGKEARRGPHGSATYRLNIALPSETGSYTLELPEIYSAYTLYINGALMAAMGETGPEGYRPKTGNTAVTVQAAGQMEILLAVSDYSHFYSGLVYPPAFGNPNDVANLLNTRLVIRVLADAVAACVGLLYLCVWLLTGKEKAKGPERALPLYYAALCACFVLYTCYPVVKTLFPGGMGWYMAENFAYCAMFLFVMLIQRRLTDADDNVAVENTTRKLFRPFFVFGVFVCCWALAVPFVMGDSLAIMMAYSRLIGLYAWSCALVLTAGAAYGVYKARRRGAARGMVMLAGISAFDAALIMDRLLPMFEPIRFGWFTELAGGMLVLLTGFVMAAEVARQFRLRRAMESRVESVSRMLDVQRAYYPALLKKEEEVRAARHDLRHHIAVIRQLVSRGGGKLEAYLDAFEDKSVKTAPDTFCRHYVANMLLSMYAGLAKRQGTEFQARATLPESIPVEDVDLCVILSNLLENALEATRKLPGERRCVSVVAGYELGRLGIVVTNPFTVGPRVEKGRFLSSKQAGREGVGLASVRAICQSCGGSANFYADQNNVFHSEVILPLISDEKISEENNTKPEERGKA